MTPTNNRELFYYVCLHTSSGLRTVMFQSMTCQPNQNSAANFRIAQEITNYVPYTFSSFCQYTINPGDGFQSDVRIEKGEL